MKTLLFTLVCTLSFSALAARTPVSERILSTLGAGTHMAQECATIVTATDDTVTVEISDERDVLKFTSDTKESVIKDDSTADTLDITVRRTVTENGDISVQIRRLVVANGTAKVSQLKRGISGRMNTLLSIQCDLHID